MKEIWKRRSLIMEFSTTELKIKYKNSVVGFFWSFLEPLLLLGVLYLAFTTILKNSISNYPLYLLLGLILWNMYSRGTTMGLVSLIGKAGLISKTNFPREIPVISSTLTSFFMMCFEFTAFSIFVIIFHFMPPLTVLMLPIVLVLLFVYCLGISFALSVLSIKFRDLQSIWAVILQATFFISPIFLTLDIYPREIIPIISLNPLVMMINMAHDVTLYGKFPTYENLFQTIGASFVILGVGYGIFRLFNKRIIEEI